MRRKPSPSASSAIDVPGSVMATKWRGSGCRPRKWASSAFGSIVPPDLEETMNSVVARSIGSATALTCERLGGVEHVQAQRALGGRVGAPEDLGGEARAAHAEQHDVGEPVLARRAHELLDLRQVLEQLVGDRQPAEPVLDLRRAGRRPQRAVLAPQAPHDVLLGGLRQALRDGRLELVGQVGLQRRRAARDDRLALGLDAGEQLVHRHHERVDALAQQLVGDVARGRCRPRAAREVGARVLGGGRAA